MRIPLKDEHEYLQPALDLSEKKIVWFLYHDTEEGDEEDVEEADSESVFWPLTIFIIVLSLIIFFVNRWENSLADENNMVFISKLIGERTVIYFYIAAAIFGFLIYIATIMLDDLTETKEFKLEKSIEMYYKFPKHSTKPNVGFLKKLLAIVFLMGIFFWSLTIPFNGVDLNGRRSSVILAGLFPLVAIVWMTFKITSTAASFFARGYVARRFDINSKKPSPLSSLDDYHEIKVEKEKKKPKSQSISDGKSRKSYSEEKIVKDDDR